ncbi:MAG: TPM domain-containing protein [Betaproteobacteria bacterium]|nr:TPM domain-containing protein [Betaproteobacteria bacterium]
MQSQSRSPAGRNWFFPLVLILASLLIASARGEVAIPPLTSRVTDLTNTLSPQQRAALEQKLAAFESAKGNQIAVLIVPTTQPEAIEQYSIRVVDQWKWSPVQYAVPAACSPADRRPGVGDCPRAAVAGRVAVRAAASAAAISAGAGHRAVGSCDTQRKGCKGKKARTKD